jgi:hypothetical protein
MIGLFTWEHGFILSVALVLLAFAGMVASPLWARRIPIHDDLGAYYFPLRVLYAQALARNDSIDWFPQIYGGFFLTGEGQLGTHHPFHLVIYKWLPTDVAFDFEIALPYVLMPAGIILLLRRFVGAAGAAMGAIFFTYSLLFSSAIFNPTGSLIYAHLPWNLWAMIAVVEPGALTKRRLACAAVALLTGSQVLLGYPQYTYFCLLTEAVFGAFLYVHYRPTWRMVAALVGAYMLAAGLAAVQLLATYAHLGESLRANPTLELKCYDSMRPGETLGVIAPYLHWRRVPGRGLLGYYLGAVPLLLGLWWLTAHRASRVADAASPDAARSWSAARRLSFFALGLLVLTTWLACGKYGQLYFLQTHLPIIGKFRCPYRYTIAASFAAMLIGAIAFGRLTAFVRSGQMVSRRHLVLPWLAALASAALAGWYAWRCPGAPGIIQQKLFVAPLIFGTAAVALTLAARGWRIGLFILLGVAAADATIFNLSFVSTCWSGALPTSDEFLHQRSGPPGPCPCRLYDRCWGMNRWAAEGGRVVNGYAGLAPAKQLDYEHVNTLRAAEVSWFRNWDWYHPSTPVAGLGPNIGEWRQVPDPLPRARLVSRAVVSAEPGIDLKSLDVDSTVLTARAVNLPASTPGQADIRTDRPGLIEADVEAPAKQLLTISESYHSGWTAQVDGEAVDVERVNGDFIGCVVPAGSHRVRLEFDPLFLRIGKAVSWTALLVCAWLALGAFRRNHRRPAPDSPV